MNGPAYWKRVYYRENIAARFAREDAEADERKARAEQAEAMANGVRRTQSDSALAKPPGEVKDAYAHIKAP